MKKVEQKLRRSNQLINLAFFFFLLPYQTWKPDNHCHPTTSPFSCPSHLCVCTAAISKSISCQLLFLLAQFCTLHLPQGDKILPPGPDWTIFTLVCVDARLSCDIGRHSWSPKWCWCVALVQLRWSFCDAKAFFFI